MSDTTSSDSPDRPEGGLPMPMPRGASATPEGGRALAPSEPAAAMEGLGVSDAVGDDLSRILDIPLEIHVELGRKRLRISELVDVGSGSVIDLGTAAGAPLSIYANRMLIAQGEAVVVGDRYGIRVTDIISPEERVRRLGGAGEA